MAANNLRIVYDNVADYTTSTIVASSTASSTALASNLKSDTRGLFWRSATHTSFNIPAVFKNAVNSTTTGRHSNVTITVTAGGGTSIATHYTLTADGAGEAATATAFSGSIITAIPDNDNKTGYTLRLYNSSAKTVLLDQQTLPVIMSSTGTVTALLTNSYHRCPGTSTSTAIMTNSGTNILVFDGTSPLRYEVSGGTTPGTYTVTRVGNSITAGALSAGTGGAFAVVAAHSAPTLNTSTVVYTITGRTLANVSINTTTTQTVVVSANAETVYHNSNFDTTAARSVLEIENIPTTAQAVGTAVLTHTNLSQGATMRVLGYNSAVTLDGTADIPYHYSPSARVFDTGSIICCPFNNVKQNSWVQNTYGTVTYGIDKQTVRAYVPPGIQTTCSVLVIEILDLQNTDNYIEASRLICGRYWSPVHNTEYGLSVGLEDTSESARSEDGSLITTNGVVYKTLNFNLSYLTATDRNEMVKILRNRGKRGALFISLFPDNSEDWEQESLYQLYGKLSSGFDLSHPYYQYFSTSIQLEEV